MANNIDTNKYEGHTQGPWHSLVCSTTGKKWVIDGPEDTAWNSLALVDDRNDVGWKNMALIADAPLLLEEVKRLREVILDFSMPMWNYLNSQVHPDQEGFTSNAVKSLVKNTPYESLMHLWEDACGYLPVMIHLETNPYGIGR